MAINSHVDLFSSAAYLCLQQESVSIPALSRLLEAVAKSIKHSVAMSTILATELFQARRDTAIATSKLQFENSDYELQNAPINPKSLFHNKIKEVGKSNYKAKQRILASSSTNTKQQQKASYSAAKAFKIPNYQTSHLDLNSLKCRGLKLKPSPLRPVLERTLIRGAVSPSSSPPLNKLILHKVLKTNPFHCLSCHSQIFQLEEDCPLCGTVGIINKQQMSPLYRLRRF